MNMSTYNAFIVYAIRRGFTARSSGDEFETIQLITPDGQDVYDVTYYGYHRFIHVRKTGIFEGIHNRRLNDISQASDISQARMWVDEITEEIKAATEYEKEENEKC